MIVSLSGGGTSINLYNIGSRLMMATARNGFLWACHHVGLSGTNGAYLGNESGTNVDRSGVQWLKFEVSTDQATLTLNSHGRVFDDSPTNAWWYYQPSLTINCAGDMIVGFSGSSTTNYVSALYSSRPPQGLTVKPRMIRLGSAPFTIYTDRLGDYSATSLVPVILVTPNAPQNFPGFTQSAIVPAIPEPSAFTMLILGGTFLLLDRRLRSWHSRNPKSL